MQSNGASRVQKHRASLRASGLRPVQIWVPDTRQKGFADECRRQSLVLQNNADETEALVWMQEVADTEGWK